MRPSKPHSWFTRLTKRELDRIRAQYQALAKAARQGQQE